MLHQTWVVGSHRCEKNPPVYDAWATFMERNSWMELLLRLVGGKMVNTNGHSPRNQSSVAALAKATMLLPLTLSGVSLVPWSCCLQALVLDLRPSMLCVTAAADPVDGFFY